METPSPSSATLLNPRLRLIGRSSSPRMPDNGVDNTPHAAHHRTEEDDEQLTPRIPLKTISGDPGPSTVPNSVPTNAIPSDTPVATRLRALIPRVSLPPPTVSSVIPENVPLESDSDRALSRLGSSTTSAARENLRDLFSRALRDSKPTSQNRRRRRNSVDNSQIEISPISDREEVGHHSKRRSWSDEEADMPRMTRESDSSARSSHATTFNTLRARLTSSQSHIMDVNLPTSFYDQSDMLPLNLSTPGPPRITSTSSRQLDSSLGTPPAATSTPQQSFQLPSRLTSQPNLLEQDSVMQGAVGEMLDSESQVFLPPSNGMDAINPPASLRPLVKANSIVPEPKPVLSGRELSSSDPKIEGKSKDRHYSPCEEKQDSQRERDWNRHTPGGSDTPNHHHYHVPHDSPTHVKSISRDSHTTRGSPRPSLPSRLNRRGSVASLSSFDDDLSSRPSSRSSLADKGGLVRELDRERNYERERDWNRPHPQSRPSSSLSTSSHSHAHLHPPRPLSATPYQTPTLASLRRQSSRSSLRSSSPASLASRESLQEREEEEKREVVHERERNWNSPRPKWGISKRHSLGSSGSGGTSPPAHRLSKDSIKRFSVGSHDASRPESSVSQTPDQSNVLSGHGPWHSDQFRLWLNQNHVSGSPSGHSYSPTKTPAAASRFGWHFHRQPLPPLELDSSPDPRIRRQRYIHDDVDTSSPPSSRPSSRASGIIKPSMIPVRAVSKAIPSDSHAVPVPKPKHGDDDHLLHIGSQRESAEQEDIVLASDEEAIMDFLPSQPTRSQIDAPDTASRDPDTFDAEAPASSMSPLEPRFSLPEASAADPVDEPRAAGAPLSSRPPRSNVVSPDPPSTAPVTFTPPGSPPPTSYTGTVNLEPAQHGILSTPPRQPAFSSSVLHLRTPSPPHDLSDLPDPPSSDDNVSNGTPVKPGTGPDSYPDYSTTKTPKPPGAWAATPQQTKPPSRTPSPGHLSPAETTTNLSATIPFPRGCPPNDNQTKALTTESGFTTPQSSVRTNILPLQTPAPPGAWVRTPNQLPLEGGADDQSQFGTISRRRSFLKVRFDVSESETSTAGDQSNSPLSAIRLSDPDFLEPRPSEAGEIALSKTDKPSSVCAAQQTSTIPDIPSTPNPQQRLPISRSLRKSPLVRVVDEYGREKHEAEEFHLQDSFDQNDYADASLTTSSSFHHAVTSTPKAATRNTVRIVDAMGRDIDEQPEQQSVALFNDISVTSDDLPAGRAETITRIKQAVQELREGFSDADRPSDELTSNSTQLEKLEEVSKSARIKRDQLNLKLQREVAQGKGFLNHNADKKTMRHSRRLADVIPGSRKPWNRVFVYCSVLIQLLLILVMWKYAHIEARRLFYTTYYDPLYPELYSLDGNPFFSRAHPSHPRTMLDSWETIRREGWRAIGMEIRRAFRHAGDQVWDHWVEQSYSRNERPT